MQVDLCVHMQEKKKQPGIQQGMGYLMLMWS